MVSSQGTNVAAEVDYSLKWRGVLMQEQSVYHPNISGAKVIEWTSKVGMHDLERQSSLGIRCEVRQVG